MRDIQELRERQDGRKTEEAPDRPGPAVTDGASWQSPEYEIVDTALEVTAYALATR
ncbi:pyrroloquinoline quinone precursor peptide PqqA [Streptomyces sp. NBC_00878]|uniref:pyrroloquinoline quinone precursor peptide PqqA n=1 Tax=Streptomyces sp. NBC_00878 TaxID=2975854 RepID=UPI00224ED721|nr:pyrroloquinoline quinone precursor peptide PqqA [Streptomyces sp. NBC_00878]MCX4910853.1 pyrroloquinoline quinone precursor peptide PqqA [Streptomyces sp. NBC_00878]